MNAAAIDDTLPAPAAAPAPGGRGRIRAARQPAAPRTRTLLRPGLRAGEWDIVRTTTEPILDPRGNGPRGQTFASLAAAVNALAADEPFLLGLPLDTAFVQRLELPSAPPDELTAMARLQLEKVLPFSPETLSLHWEPVPNQEDKNYAPSAATPAGEPAKTTRPLAVQAVSHERVLALGEPFDQIGRWPERTALHLGLLADAITSVQPALANPRESALLVTREAGRTVVGILEQGRLVLAQSLTPAPLSEFDETQPGTPGDLAAVAALERELPAILLAAELEDVPTNFRHLWLDARCAGWRSSIEKSLRLPVTLVPAMASASAAPIDLSPPAWQEARRQRMRAALTRKRLRLVAILYLSLVLLGLADLGWLRWRRAALDQQLARNAPRVEQVRAARARWDALAPAVELRLSVVELLDQIRQCLPPGDVRLTLFDLNRQRTPATLTLEGEAPNYASAVELSERLQARPELRGIRFTSEPPANLANGRARFHISGKLP